VEFSVTPEDRELLRDLVERFDGPLGDATRQTLRAALAGTPAAAGGIAGALLASPLFGAELDLSRGNELDLDRSFEF
jgi:hypothetical protein